MKCSNCKNINSFRLKIGKIIQCKECKKCYKTNKYIGNIFYFYYSAVLFLIPIFLLYHYIDIWLGDDNDLYAFILSIFIYLLFEYLITFIIPVKETECD